MDRISGLPDNLVEKILCYVPLVDAVRTSVLSKDWQHRWTTIPKLILDLDFFYKIDNLGKTNSIDYVNTVNSLLVQHNGYLEEVHLINPNLSSPEKEHLTYCIWIVLMKGVSKLTVMNWSSKSMAFPASLVHSPNLTHLELRTCVFKPQPPFRGFQNLCTLVLKDVRCDLETLYSFILSCSQLRKLYLEKLNFKGRILTIKASNLESLFVRGKFKSIKLEGTQSLTEMELQLELQNEYLTWDKDFLIDFYENLTGLESLKLGHRIHYLLQAASLLKKLPRPLYKLKILKFAGVHFDDVAILRSMLCLISSSPNIRKLEIICYPLDGHDPKEELDLQEEDYEHCSLECLEKIHIGPIIGIKSEIDVIKFLFRHSGALQMFDIWYEKRRDRPSLSEQSKLFKKFPRASPRVKVRHSYEYTKLC